jgi:spore germination protein YaaH
MSCFAGTRSHRLRPLAVAHAAASCIAAACALSSQGCGTPGLTLGSAQREVWGFTAFWDSASAASVARNGASLDALVTTWIALDTATGLPTTLHLDSASANRVPARRLALVTSYIHPSFRPATIRRLAANPRLLSRVAGLVASALTAAGNEGAVLDFESHTPGDLPALLAVVSTIADTLHARRLGPVVVAVPALDTTSYPGQRIIDAGADMILPMLYDQHWAGGAPGPVAEPRWVDRALGIRVREVGPSRVAAGLPLYGYRWPAAGQGVTVSFAEASRGVDGEVVSLARDSATGSLRGDFAAGGQVWVTDATLLRNLLTVVEQHGVTAVALWYVGQEDPAIWGEGILRSGRQRQRR